MGSDEQQSEGTRVRAPCVCSAPGLGPLSGLVGPQCPSVELHWMAGVEWNPDGKEKAGRQAEMQKLLPV